ncbi:hypothetical protein GE061_005328 [Apolygus lucorum]|uniref:Uncharacterized protein n=1 Tax=Apolygus lucorum TaxID=248454 RepID=A0A6A4IUB2_APOLU|nr:hypothetical protein GE061_005328 [Apolygus lucorum]
MAFTKIIVLVAAVSVAYARPQYFASAGPLTTVAHAPISSYAVAQAPIAVAPQPIAYAPAPVAVAPQPIAVAPQPIIAQAAPAIVTRPAEEYDPHPQYSFTYNVNDPSTGDSKQQTETRDGDNVQGSYSLVEPDGSTRTVEYTADSINGFNAVVHKGPASHPASAPIAVASQPIAVAPQPIAYAPAPVAVAPQPIAYAPAPVAVAPQPIAYAPAPISYAPAPVSYASAQTIRYAAAAPAISTIAQPQAIIQTSYASPALSYHYK